MPFYVSPEQQMRDKASYAQQGVARGRSCVALQYADGILMVAPNASKALHKISELYDRIAFAAVGRYNEYENLRKAGVTYADIIGYQFDRSDVTARGIANYYAQELGRIFIESNKPFEVELVVAEVGDQPDDDQIYRITFDGSVTDESGYVAFGGDVGKVSAVLKERYSEGMTLGEAFGAAFAALSALSAPSSSGGGASSSSSGSATSAGTAASGNGGGAELAASQLEVAILERSRDHRKFRRIRAARLEELLAESRAATARAAEEAQSSESGTSDGESGTGDAQQG
ncbi:MAG TPA: proteasome subunit alpha [Streptosporangiaceae bacterium]